MFNATITLKKSGDSQEEREMYHKGLSYNPIESIVFTFCNSCIPISQS